MLNAFQCSILVKAPFDWVENNEDGKRGMEKEERKIGLKMKFSLIWFREKTREKENGVQNNPSKST